MARAENLVGKRFGRYIIRSEAGRGGMGKVYLAHDDLLDRPVALKSLDPQQEPSPLDMARFYRESRILSKLDHPNICRIYDLVLDQDHIFLCLEWIEGVSLKKLLKQGMSYTSKLRIFCEIAKVLQQTHNAEIIHRDLKPENIMVTHSGVVKVLDFGLGRLNYEKDLLTSPKELSFSLGDSLDSGQTTLGSVVGTLWYLSPEGARGEETSTASDLYSLGIMMYEAFYEKKAYPKPIQQPQLLYKVGKGDREPIPLPHHLPDKLVKVIEGLCALDPNRRISAQQAYEQMVVIQSGQAKLNWKVPSLLVCLLFLVFWLKPPPIEEGTIAVLPTVFVEQGEKMPPGFRERFRHAWQQSSEWHVLPRQHTLPYIEGLGKSLDRKDFEVLLQRMGVDHIFYSEISMLEHRFLALGVLRSDNGFSKYFRAQGASLELACSALEGQLTEWLNLDQLKREPSLVRNNLQLGYALFEEKGPTDAIPFFKICLDQTPNSFEAKLALAKCYDQVGLFKVSEQLTQEIIDQSMDLKIKGEAYLRLAKLYSKRPETCSEGEKALNQAVKLLDPLYKSRFAGDFSRLRGMFASQSGDFHESIRHYNQAIDAFRQIGDSIGEALVLDLIASLQQEIYQNDQALENLERAKKIYEKAHYKKGLAKNFSHRGVIHFNQSRYVDAEQQFNMASDLFAELGDHQGQIKTLANLAECKKRTGNIQVGLELGRKVVELHKTHSDPKSTVVAIVNLGDSLHWQGQWEEAQSLALEGLDLAISNDYREMMGSSIHLLALNHFEQGDVELSEHLFELAFQYLKEAGANGKQHNLLTDWAACQIRANEARHAIPKLVKASTFFEQTKALSNELISRFQLMEAYLQMGQDTHAFYQYEFILRNAPKGYFTYLADASWEFYSNNLNHAVDLMACVLETPEGKEDLQSLFAWYDWSNP